MNQQEKLASLSVWIVGAIVFAVLTLATIAIFSSQSSSANTLGGQPYVEGDVTVAQQLQCPSTDPCMAKEFIPSVIGVGETAVLSITIVTTDTLPKDPINFTDILANGLVLASAPVDPPLCHPNATIAGVAGSSVFTVTNARLGTNWPVCTITVTVQATAPGVHVNNASNITGTTNLDPSTANAQLQVLQAPQFISSTPTGTVTITYGSLYSYTFQAVGFPPTMTYGLSGTLPPDPNFDSASGQLSGTATMAGIYPNITVSATNDVDPDATTTFTITVGGAPLTVTADDKIMLRGTNPPPLTATYSTFVNNDTVADLDSPTVLATAANSYSPEGLYPISASGTADANYIITHISGTLTIYVNRFVEKKGMPVYPPGLRHYPANHRHGMYTHGSQNGQRGPGGRIGRMR